MKFITKELGAKLDKKTIQQYDENSERFAAEWAAKLPTKLHALITEWFPKKAMILDVGSGSGRDVLWMCENGYNAEGVDASLGLIAEAKKRCPSKIFRHDLLPSLSTISSNSFDGVLASAVLMHLPMCDIQASIEALLRIAKAKGRIICSVRPFREAVSREVDGRLFTKLNIESLILLFERAGGKILATESSEVQADGRQWSTIVVEKL